MARPFYEVTEQSSISDNEKGFVLAVASGAFIGSSFIIKKLGLLKAGASGARAGHSSSSYSIRIYAILLAY